MVNHDEPTLWERLIYYLPTLLWALLIAATFAAMLLTQHRLSVLQEQLDACRQESYQ